MEQIGAISGGVTKNARRGGQLISRPYLRVANVGFGTFDLLQVLWIGVGQAELDRVTLRKGDVLFVEGNGSPDQIGRVAVWDEQIAQCVHQNHLIKVRPYYDLIGEWVRLWFSSPSGRLCIREVASSTSGLHTLSISKIARLPVPIPGEQEMLAAIREASDLLDVATETSASATTSADELTDARQSILHAAFTGHLVPQDSADEPAAALLARLRTGAAPPSAARTRRPRQKASV